MICQHFGVCGGCTLQDLSPDEYRAHKRNGVIAALARVGLGDVRVAEPVMAPLYSRRRAAFKIEKRKGVVEVGFHARASHDIVDMRECLVLTPALLQLTQVLRDALTPVLHDGEKAELHATDSDSGLDLSFRCERKLTPALTAQLAKAFAGHGIARILFNGEIAMEEAAPAVSIAGVRVVLPPGAFLQATAQGETALQSHVLALTKGAKNIADLFSGLGTFALALAKKGRVHAVEQDAGLLAALAAAARDARGLKPITTERRDLFKQPLTAAELKNYEALVLDPPRAGAEAQIRVLATAKIARIVYVSCDAASFARDAALLVGAGFVPGAVTPIDQFLYSGHIELVAGFERAGGDEEFFRTMLLGLAALVFLTGAASAAGFSDWAVLLVAGDDHAHSGAPSQVFDNARRDLARAFAGIGFSPANMVQFSVDPGKDAQETDTSAIANALWDLTDRAKGGCLIYFTSHGTPDGIIANGTVLPPDVWSKIVGNACGKRPSVIVMSSCFSGQFVPQLASPNRMVFTAARPDRTSFGCGEQDHYTFFDGCFLQALPASGNFPDLAARTRDCVSKQETALGVDYPSEPQLSIGKDVMPLLAWR